MNHAPALIQKKEGTTAVFNYSLEPLSENLLCLFKVSNTVSEYEFEQILKMIKEA